jgi:hypothetical protein
MGMREVAMYSGAARRFGPGKAQNMLKMHKTIGCAICAEVFISGPGAKLSDYVIRLIRPL